MGERKQEGPGDGPVGRIGIALVTFYLVAFSAALLYCLFAFWPGSATSQTIAPEDTRTRVAIQRVVDNSPPSNKLVPGSGNDDSPSRLDSASVQVRRLEPSEIKFVIWKFSIGEETRLLLLVVCAGALGSLVHGLRSIYWYIGNRDLIWSWVPKYLIQPFGASVLAVVFYLVIRGGFFSADAGSQHTSPFGFMALSAMVGMFSEQAVLKLKEISETLLSKPASGKDSVPQSPDQGKVNRSAPKSLDQIGGD
jgi:hypothetical protein